MTTADPPTALEIPFTASSRGRDHVPGGEVYVGIRTPGTEVPERAALIEAELIAAGARRVEAEPQPDSEALALHDPALIDWLSGAWSEWERSGLAEDPGADRVTPYLFPHPGLLAGMRPAGGLEPPASVAARAGLFAYDTMTLIGPGTWEAARGALDAALGAADLVAAGEPLAYALCRPPGHHATRSAIGGSCYLNNAAAAAARLRERLDGPVAVLDIDAHHGNGTQQIFWGDGSVLTGSVHVDPGAGWFPHYLGFADETGTGDGRRRQPQRPARSRIRRRRLARGRRRPRPLGHGRCGPGPRRRARGRRRRRRPREPARGDGGRLPAGGRAARQRSACRPSSSRRAATTSRRSARSSARP